MTYGACTVINKSLAIKYKKNVPPVGNAIIKVIRNASKLNATIRFHIGAISIPSGAVAATAACAIVPGLCTLTGESAITRGWAIPLKGCPQEFTTCHAMRLDSEIQSSQLAHVESLRKVRSSPITINPRFALVKATFRRL